MYNTNGEQCALVTCEIYIRNLDLDDPNYKFSGNANNNK